MKNYLISEDITGPNGTGGAYVDLLTDGHVWTLRWTDGINSWEETYMELAPALARVAILAECAQSDWQRGFTDTDPHDFATRWQRFARKATT